MRIPFAKERRRETNNAKEKLKIIIMSKIFTKSRVACSDIMAIVEFRLQSALIIINMPLRIIIIIIRGATALRGPRPTSRLLASRSLANAEVNDHPTSTGVTCGQHVELPSRYSWFS